MKTKTFLFGILLLLLSVTFIYKWYEWKSLKDLVSLYSFSVTGELKLVSGLEERSIDWTNKTKEFYISASQSAELQTKTYSDLESSNDLLTNSHDEFMNTEKDNKQKYLTLKNRFKLLFGQNSKIAKKIIDDQINFYDTEIKSGAESKIVGSFYKNLAMIYDDFYKIRNFNKVAINNQTTKDNFELLSSIAKYSEDSFKYYDEEAIKGYAPEEYKILLKEKRYFSSFYELVKLTLKDQESSQNAINLRNKLNQDIANINIDYANLFSDKKDISLSNYKKEILLTSDQLLNIYEVNNKKLFSYPLLGVIKFQKYDLWHCQFYEFKSGYYNLLYKKYPDSKNSKELISTLSSLSPNTNLLDKQFNFSVLTLENTPEKFNVTCIDKDNDEKYAFSLLK